MSSLQANSNHNNNKNEEMRLRFLKMAKQFNWNRAHISNNTKPPSSPSQPNILLELPNPQHTTPNPNTSINHSIIDSEATESESSNETPSNQHNHLQTIPANNTNKNIPSSENNNQHHYNTSKHQLDHLQGRHQSHSLMLPSTNIKNSVKTSNSPTLKLTEHNLSKFNLSLLTQNNYNNKENINQLEIKNQSPASTPTPSESSVSSVLSKHNFTLLEISSSDDDEQDDLDETSKDKDSSLSSKSMDDKLDQKEYSQNEENNDCNINYLGNNRDIKNKNEIHQSGFGNSPSIYATTYSQEPPSAKEVNIKSSGGAFLDLCSSESDSESQDDKNRDASSLFKRIMEKRKSKSIKSNISTFSGPPRKPRERLTKTIAKCEKYDYNDCYRIDQINPKILCDIKISPKQFKKQRDEYTSLLFERLNMSAFGNNLKLNKNITYSWCKTLNKTAGDCRLFTKNKTRMAHIRLATKVLDNLDKLKQTFCHEMCHAMAWIVHSNRKPPHGQHFKYWAHEAELAFDDVKVTTCHNYKIQYKFQWQCVDCKYIYGRHSKSIRIESHRCGVCRGKLEFLGRLRPDGTFIKQTKKRAPTKFNIFMKENMGKIKQQFPGAKHGEIMRILSERYKLIK